VNFGICSKFFGLNFGPSVFITFGSLNSLATVLATLLPKFKKKNHLDFPYRKVEAIKLGWGLDAVTNGSHVCVTNKVMGQIGSLLGGEAYKYASKLGYQLK